MNENTAAGNWTERKIANLLEEIFECFSEASLEMADARENGRDQDPDNTEYDLGDVLANADLDESGVTINTAGYKEAGLLTHDTGVVITIKHPDGRRKEFQITIQQSK